MDDQKVLVIGLGESGKATVEYLLKEGYSVVGVDAKWEREELSTYRNLNHVSIGPDTITYVQDLSLYQFVVVSPGIAQKHPLYVKALEEKIPLVGESELILSQIHQPCIGITGTNGKTTLTLLIEHLFKTAGIPSRAVGNVGYPFTRYALDQGLESNETLVCELSSYQLETLSAEVLDVGVILQITPDHLDRYSSFKEYAYAKLKMVHCIKSSGRLLVHHEVAAVFHEELKACKGKVMIIPPLFTNPSEDSYLQLRKKREYCDFLGLCQERMLGLEMLYVAKEIAAVFGIQDEQLGRAITTFVKPPHRLEFVAEIQGVRFVNDSKATNVESVMYAVGALQGELLLIAGGKDKDLDFRPWKKSFVSRVRKLFVIGEAAEKIQQTMQDEYDVEKCKDLEDATRKAFLYASKVESIILSPGCASFDSYRNYMHRGESFKEIVQALKKECSG